MTFSFDVHITSAEECLFKGKATHLIARGKLGDLGISFGHAPLLTSLIPGTVKVTDVNGKVELYYISGGLLEVQPYMTTILADTAERAIDVDEKAAIAAKKAAEEILSYQDKYTNLARADLQLVRAVAQLKTIQALRNRSS